MKPSVSVVELARMKRAAQEQGEQSGQARRPRVLFVDDEERILRAMQALFRAQYEVVTTTSGAQALEMLRTEHFHVLVSDQRMPEMQGIEVLRQAREISPNTVRLLLTGYSDLSAIIASINDGEVFRYLSKPWLNDELHATLAKAVDAGLAMEAGAEGLTNGPAVLPPALAAVVKGPSTVQLTPTRPELPGQALGHGEAPVDDTVVLFIERSEAAWGVFRAEGYTDVRTMSATSPEHALELMQEHEVSVVVVAIDGENHPHTDFLYLLKKEHPHVVSIVVSDVADSGVVVGLINAARVFRVIFRPVKPGALHMYIKSAQRQAAQFRITPAALKTQQTAGWEGETRATAPRSTAPAMLAGIGQKLLSIKSFFRRH